MFHVRVPNVTFKTRVEIDDAPGFGWKDLTSLDIFAGKRVVVFALPGAFTPTCSSTHLPGFENLYDDIRAEGIDEIYCLSVNDSFVMNAWLNDLEITKIKPIPDGTGEFTRKMGFLVSKDNLGFGMRSWRYAMVVNDGIVEQFFVEDGFGDEAPNDPFAVSDAGTVLQYLQSVEVKLVEVEDETVDA